MLLKRNSAQKGKVGEWVRHTSSSGKEYYYHVNKQISQWEKPREWVEYEKRHGPVPNTPYVSSSQKQNQAKSQQHQQHQQQQAQTHHHNSNHVNSNSGGNANASSGDQRERDRLARPQNQGHQHHNSTVATNSFPSYSSSGNPAGVSNVHHHSHHNNSNNHKLDSNSNPSSHQHQGSFSLGGRPSVGESRNAGVIPTLNSGVRDTRKPSEDLQTEDMDISPLDDSNSPVSSDSKHHLNSHSHNYQSHHHSQHFQSKNLHDGSESSRDENNLRNSAYHQYPNSGRLIHPGNSSLGNNNGYHGRDRDRDMRDSPRRIDSRDSRDYRDKDREYRDYRDKDSRDRDRGDRLRRDRDARDSPRRHDRDRNDRDRDHRSRNRDRDHRDRLRNRSNSRLRDERSRSPRERDSTPERPGGDSAGVSGLGSLGALAALNSDTDITPLQSLAQYFRKDLIAHAKDLPGDELERQANLLSDEIMTTSSVQLSKVCAELKMARSLVRLTDIQATLQDQRILFLRQQIKNLEESDRDNSSSILGLDTGDS